MVDMKFAPDPLYNGRWAGYCYDGPIEGKWKESQEITFWVHVQCPVRYPYSSMPHVAVEIDRVLYRWSAPLRAWVAVNMR